MVIRQDTSQIENLGLDEELFNSIISITQGIPAHQNLNMELRCLAPGQAELEMMVGPEFTNSYGIAHGGIIATFADSAMGVALRTLNFRVVTIEMNINYFTRVNVGEKLKTNASAVHVGSQVVVAEAEVYNSKNKLVAKSRATFFRVGSIM